MTREQQIVKLVDDYKASDPVANQLLNRNAAFGLVRHVLEWADSHPAWVSVEDELPPLHYEGANSTDFVLIYDGDDVLIAYYNFKEKKWYNEQYGALIIPATHWMPLPQPPVKKGSEE